MNSNVLDLMDSLTSIHTQGQMHARARARAHTDTHTHTHTRTHTHTHAHTHAHTHTHTHTNTHTHGHMQAAYSSSNVLGLKDPSRPFPTGSELGILKWRMASKVGAGLQWQGWTALLGCC